MRIDKYLWAIRVFKTRSQATAACKAGKVSIDERLLKPSYLININDNIDVKKPPVKYTYKVIDLPKSRVGAKLVANYTEDLTPEEEIKKLHVNKEVEFIIRDRGAGRPTKKERRDMGRFFD